MVQAEHLVSELDGDRIQGAIVPSLQRSVSKQGIEVELLGLSFIVVLHALEHKEPAVGCVSFTEAEELLKWKQVVFVDKVPKERSTHNVGEVLVQWAFSVALRRASIVSIADLSHVQECLGSPDRKHGHLYRKVFDVE